MDGSLGRQEAASAALLPEVPREQPERVEREQRSLWWVRRADARARVRRCDAGPTAAPAATAVRVAEAPGKPRSMSERPNTSEPSSSSRHGAAAAAAPHARRGRDPRTLPRACGHGDATRRDEKRCFR